MMNAGRRPMVVLILAVCLSAGVLAGCIDGGATGPTPKVPPGIWSTSGLAAPRLLNTLGDPLTSGIAGWPGPFDNSPELYDIDGDGSDEVIVHSTDTNVYVFSSSTGRILATLPTKYPPAWHIERVLNAVQAAVLRPGEAPSLVVTNHAAYVAVWRFDADESGPDRFTFSKQWELRMDSCHRSPGMDAAATLADVDGDATLEILVQTEEIGFYALKADGTSLWQKCWGGGNSAPAAADLNGDGSLEVIVASDAGRVSVLAGSSGDPLWTFDAAAHGIKPASISVTPTVADLDGLLPLEILFTARVAASKDPATFSENHLAIFAIRQSPITWQAELVWMRQPLWANPLSNTQLVVTDVDGDARADIFGMDWNTIGHYPGDWERLGPAHVFRLDERGDDVWVREVDAWWSNQDIVVADSDGDEAPDVLVNGPGEGGDGIWRLSAANGTAQGFLGLWPWKMLRGPLIADVQHDGSLDLLVPVEPMDSSQGRGAVLIFELVETARAL